MSKSDQETPVVASLEEIPLSEFTTAEIDALGGIDRILLYHLPLVTEFRSVTARDGLLLHGSEGWAEAAPFWDYEATESSRWLAAGIEWANTPHPETGVSIPVNVTIPIQSPEEAHRRVLNSGGCAAAKVKVAGTVDGHTQTLMEDCARVEAVADALAATVGAEGARIRVDVNALWNVEEAQRALRELNAAASLVGGLEYVEQPCADVDDLARLRRIQDVPIAADESIRRAADPLEVFRKEAADIAIVKLAPIGGMTRIRDIAAAAKVDLVMSSALETSVGLSAGLQAAAELGIIRACGLATMQLLAADVVSCPLDVQSGFLPATAKSPDLSLLGKRPLPHGLCQRWIQRLHDMLSRFSA